MSEKLTFKQAKDYIYREISPGLDLATEQEIAGSEARCTALFDEAAAVCDGREFDECMQELTNYAQSFGLRPLDRGIWI